MRSLGLVLVVLLAVLAGGCGGDGDGNGGNSDGAKAPAATSEPSPAGTTNGPDSARPDAREGEDRAQETNSRKARSRRTRSRKTRSERKQSGRQGSAPGSRRVERYLRDNFGGGGDLPKASWYDRIVEVVVTGATTTLRTNLSDDSAGKKVARQICMNVRGSIPGLTDTVEVTGLAGASNLARCVP